jgi:hypothetical protein
MVYNIGHDVSFSNKYEWSGIQEKTEEIQKFVYQMNTFSAEFLIGVTAVMI